MAIAQADVLVAAGDTTNAASRVTGSAAPTANRLLLFVIAYSGVATMPVPSLSGGPSVTWEAVTQPGDGQVSTAMRLTVFAALSGASPGSGAITITASTGSLTGSVYYMAEFSGTFLGGSALESIYGYNVNSGSGLTTIKAAPSGYQGAGDATVATCNFNVNAAITSEDTELADIGYSTPTNRLGVQWFNGNDSDGPTFTWVGSATAICNSFYLRAAENVKYANTGIIVAPSAAVHRADRW